ncbi:motility associated factor glycosyltransferase family protein [Campylobacter jejuni]|uniref:motility associated factor glycosyltransferase family protein n=1 Tax=Campylobacter jejuni TaxID=197 RepID=UPI000F7FB5C4|nr:motility associated factor glycosyltransferase family protein [Campylobacter jejuni]RTJ48678.1 PseD protein [Campylobacter jejuni]
MTFNPTQKKLFDKNLNALSNLILKEGLKKIKDTKFELVLGKDNLDINLKDTSDNTFLYENVISELNTMLNTYNDKYLLYPVLYFYGFGNGILFKALLQNKNHQHIVVFEKDLEIIWTMFHILDFTLELKDGRLILFDLNKTTIEDLNFLINCEPFFNFIRVYFLELSSNYYEKFHEDILKFNQKITHNISQIIKMKGNDSQDALQGIEQFIYNLPQMIKNPSYKELINKRAKLSDTAIIVSTGPSLTKQLPLLKKYSNKATIIAADSSYPILYKHNIKPDYVLSLERIPLTSEFFNNDFGEFDKDIVFIINYLTHIKTIQNLQRNKRNFMLVLRDSNFIESLNLKHFGYLVGGQSVAHIAYGTAAFLMHKNIILIGQDLAYAEDGSSHPKEHIYGSFDKYSQEKHNHLTTIAYGGDKLVYTSEIWNLFRTTLNHHIEQAKNFLGIKTYNCTEGGARIEEAIEKPFKWVCENLLSKEPNKPFPIIQPLSSNKQNELMLKSYFKICKNIIICKKHKIELLKNINLINKTLIGIENKDLNEAMNILNQTIQKIDQIKLKIDNEIQKFTEILGPLLTQFELNLARIYVLNPKTPEDSFNKSLLWIKEHQDLLKSIYGHIEIQEVKILENISSIENDLKNRNLNKWLNKIKNQVESL